MLIQLQASVNILAKRGAVGGGEGEEGWEGGGRNKL